MQCLSRHHRCRTLGGMFMLATALWNLKYVFYSLIIDGMQQPPPLTILVWSWPFHAPQNVSMDTCSHLYNIPNCWLTDNHSAISEADIVLFHHKELVSGGMALPIEKRPPGQVWVWATLESPSNTRRLYALNGSLFNWTMTYRQNSDIFVPYGWLVPQKSHSFPIPNKTGLVSWVISNYKKKQERAAYYKNLSAHINIDVYGRAVRKPLCSECLLPTVSKYKFYLAFENSIHQDYITEKMWTNAFAAGAVPVVLGPPRTNYELFIPKDAFIHIDDFASPAELARFLKTMNSSKYQQYFRWRNNHTVKTFVDWGERFCSICVKYNSLPREKVYQDLSGWFRGKGKF